MPGDTPFSPSPLDGLPGPPTSALKLKINKFSLGNLSIAGER
jgi:hypothetical protein